MHLGTDGTKLKFQANVQEMSVEIDIENFPNLSSVFEEIERKWESAKFTTQTPEAAKSCIEERTPIFSINTAIEPATRKKEERKTRSSTMTEPRPPQYHNQKRRASTPIGGHTLRIAEARMRIQSTPPFPVIDRAKLQADTRLTEAANKLSDEELALLYEDILKPLDFFGMLHERRKWL